MVYAAGVDDKVRICEGEDQLYSAVQHSLTEILWEILRGMTYMPSPSAVFFFFSEQISAREKENARATRKLMRSEIPEADPVCSASAGEGCVCENFRDGTFFLLFTESTKTE